MLVADGTKNLTARPLNENNSRDVLPGGKFNIFSERQGAKEEINPTFFFQPYPKVSL